MHILYLCKEYIFYYFRIYTYIHIHTCNSLCIFVNHTIQSTRLFHDSLNEVSALELLKMPKDLETITFGRHFNELRWQSRVGFKRVHLGRIQIYIYIYI